MYRKFSDRIGATKPVPIQIESTNEELFTSIWNLISRSVFSDDGPNKQKNFPRVQFIAERFLKLPRDEVSSNYQKWLKNEYDDMSQWWAPYNWLDFLANHSKQALRFSAESFITEANRILEEEISGYRFIGVFIAPITSSEEIESITAAINISNSENLYGSATHLNTAIDLLSKKPNPDYRNSIKESISSIESLIRQLTSDTSGNFDKALNKLDAKLNFHGGFKQGLLNLYGYTSDENGIRHAILEETNLGFDEAKFMLVTCSALVNLIVAKANQSSLLP